MSSLLVGAVLTFATVDASALQLTVSLSETATISVDWAGQTYRARTAGPHTFQNLPAPTTAPLTYTLHVAGEPRRDFTVPALTGDHLRIALYGDSRGGTGPHGRLVEQIVKADPAVLVHTGDVIQWSGDRTGWTQHLATTLPLSSSVPLILALGNHELWEYWRVPEADRKNPLDQAMRQIPSPEDPIAVANKVHPACFHVRIGDTLIVSLDSNRPMGPGSPVSNFLLAVLKKHQDARVKLVAMHHGPLSSGHHGSHAAGGHLVSVAHAHGVTAFLAGHDHVYERIVQDRLTTVVSGGGGAPLYQRENWVSGSQAFSSTYNWVQIDIGAPSVLTAYSVEGVLLDRAQLPPPQPVPVSVWPPWALGIATLLIFSAFMLTVVRVVLGRIR